MCWLETEGRLTGTVSVCVPELKVANQAGIREADIDYQRLPKADQKYINCAIQFVIDARDNDFEEQLDVLYAELARRANEAP